MNKILSLPIGWTEWISVPGGAVVVPGDLLLRRDFSHSVFASEDHVSIREERGVNKVIVPFGKGV
jgi:hypothetical protein